MAERCNVDSGALKSINSRISILYRRHRKGELSLLDVKSGVIEYFNKFIHNDYYVDDNAVNEIANVINTQSIRYGLSSEDPNFFSLQNFKNIMSTQLLGGVVNTSLSASTDNIVDKQQILLKYDASRRFLDDAYGLAKEVSIFALNQSNLFLFDSMFINRGSIEGARIGTVRNTQELNDNIRNYQELLLKRICLYLNTVVNNSPNLHASQEVKNLLNDPHLFESDGTGGFRRTKALELLKPLIDSFLSTDNFSADVLRQLYNDMNNSVLSLEQRSQSRLRLLAYNAKVFLNNFDSYLKVLLGDAIMIQDFGFITGKNKYLIGAKVAKLLTTWRENDNIDVESEADVVTKLAIITTPLRNWLEDTPIDGQYLTFLHYNHIIGKVKELAKNEAAQTLIFDDDFVNNRASIWDTLSDRAKMFLKGHSLADAISLLRQNPRQYIDSIFEVLTNKNLYDIYSNTIFKDFTRDELNKLYSVSRGLFNGVNSLRALTDINFDLDYYAYLTQTADGIFDVNYLQYYRDLDGIVQVRTLQDLGTYNIRRTIEQTINTRDSRTLIKDYNTIINYLGIVPNSNLDSDNLIGITFTIPATDIKVNVSLSSGTVTFTDTKTGRRVSDYLGLWLNKDIRFFVDLFLRIRIGNDLNFLNALAEEVGGFTNMCLDLLSFASRVVANLYVSNTVLKDLNYKDGMDKLNSLYAAPPRWNYALDEMGLVHSKDFKTLKNIAKAKANVQGLTIASLVKDGSGNGLSNLTLSRLLGSLYTQWALQEKKANSASNHFVLLNTPGLLENIYTAKEYYDSIDTKSSIDMTVSEMSYAGIVQDFVKGLIYNDDYIDDVVGNYHVLFLPSVNSDKNTIGRIRVNISKEVTLPNGVTKKVYQLTNPELRQLIASEFGQFYKKSYDNIINTWKTIDDELKVLYPNILFPSLAEDFKYSFLNFNKFYINNIERLRNLGSDPVTFVKNFVRNYNRSHRLHPLELIDWVHYEKGKYTGSDKAKYNILKSNLVLLAQIARFNPEGFPDPSLLGNYPSAELFWSLKNSEVLKSLLKAGTIINTTNISQPELRYLRENYKNWINKSGNLILAKINGVPIVSSTDIKKLYDGDVNEYINNNIGSIELNPLLELYNLMDYLFTLEFMNTTVGSFMNHPPKGAFSDIIEEEAAMFLALTKRNVSMTAAMHPFLLNLLNGIPEDYNIAVVEDIHDEQGTIIGLLNDIKPFDGATFVNPFVVILENNSLGGAKAGITKKLFVHFKNEATGTGGIIKTAGFGLTNDCLRNSPNLITMMRKMTDHAWLNEDGSSITDKNILLDYNGKNIVFKPIYFKRDNKFYKATINYLGNNNYSREVLEVSILGLPIGDVEVEAFNNINTNYKLWNMFGGMYSMEIDPSTLKLKLSNTSVENVVTAMNYTGTPRNGATNIETLQLLWQPLKHVDVHYVVTAGAIKLGGANINPITSLISPDGKTVTDDIPLDILKIHMYLAGIQLDKEHHADLSELSLMTLVISACASRGFTFEAASRLYSALRTATDILTADHLNAVKKLFANASKENEVNFLEIMMKTIIDSLSTDTNTGNFAKIIADNLIKLAQEGTLIKYSEVLLPLSDSTIYSKVLSTVTSYLTTTGIRLKIPGILSVLTPSYELFKLYAGRKYESFTNPELELAELLKQLVPVFDLDYLYSPEAVSFAGLKIEYALPNTLLSTTDGKPVGTKNRHDGTIQLDMTLLRLLFENKAWRHPRNSEPLNRDFNTFDDYLRFVLLHEAMHEIYPLIENEEKYNYETRINNEALKRFDNSINNLELGRWYNITRLVDVPIENADGSFSVISDYQTESKLIRTPEEYKLLKLDIQDNKVSRVVEDVTKGRNLAGYNVRFRSTDGNSFLLWDLDSATALFNLNELRKGWTGSLDDIVALQNLYREIFNIAPNITQETSDLYINTLGIRLNRMLLNDLANLSPSSPSKFELYQLLLNSYQNTPEWYRRYACWVNILLGRPDGSKIKINGLLVDVNSTNFDAVNNIVSKQMQKANLVRINKKYITVDKNSLRQLAYELILPKTFATNFGLDEFSDLNLIALDPDFFIKLYLRNLVTKVSNNQFDILLKNSNGNHYYLLSPERATTSGLHKLEGVIYFTDSDNKKYRLDSENNVMYELTPDAEIYADDLGNEVIVTDDLLFYINNLHYDGVRISHDLVTSPSSIETIAEYMKDSSNNIARRYYNYFTENGRKKLPFDIILKSEEISSITEDNYSELLEETDPIIRLGREKHSAFLKSLDVIAARIPAQSLQSYMPMKIVAFDNPDINTAFVSTYLILLLGSDYDIDAVSVATYDISNNGTLLLWSPYANIITKDNLEASMQLPFPTGNTLTIELVDNISQDNIDNIVSLLQEYSDILSINENLAWNLETKDYETDPTSVSLNLMLNTPELILKFRGLLLSISRLVRPNENDIYNLLRIAAELQNSRLVTFKFKNPALVNSIFELLQKIVNNHNLYFDKLSKYNITKAVNNYIMNSMYQTGIDPVNLIEALTSVDGTTGPLKRVADRNVRETKEASRMTAGNAINKFEGINNNLVGKGGIGICAVGLKGFFGLTQYCNYLLNKGTLDLLENILLGSNHNGVIIGNKVYRTLANIHALNPSTIYNYKVLEALAGTTNDLDAALILSALLSLATDNAKELKLAKLNATTKTLGMYIYGISIGMKFDDIANILMSDVGTIFTKLLDSNVFEGTDGYSLIKYAFDYFDKGPSKQLYKFNKVRDPLDLTMDSPLQVFTLLFGSKLPDYTTNRDGDEVEISERLAAFAYNPNQTVLLKLLAIDSMRNAYHGSPYGLELYNLLLDFAESYIVQGDTIGKNYNIYQDLKTLSEGADEMRTLGLILGLNLGLKSKSDEIINQINNIERAIYNKTENPEDIINLLLFCMDDKYRLLVIDKYESIKHSFNIFDAISKVPHFMGYLLTLATSLLELNQSFRFRSIRNMSLDSSNLVGDRKESKILKGLSNLVGDYMRDLWLLLSEKTVIIPAGNKAFDSLGNNYTLSEDTPVQLGTDWGNATFRAFIENEVIPNLQNGIINVGRGSIGDISNNEFIKDLTNDAVTNTVSRNASIVVTLPINMLPRTDSERAQLNSYIAEFNKLAMYNYQYEVNTRNLDGTIQTSAYRMPLVDIFTYYALIANNWRLSERSLVPILEGFQNTGIIKEFHEFVAALDKSGLTLSMDDFSLSDLLPYIVPSGNPYSAYTSYIRYRDPVTRKFRIMQKMSKSNISENDEATEQSGADIEFDRIGNYEFLSDDSDVNTNYFPKGTILKPNKIFRGEYLDDNTSHLVSVDYDIATEKINSISVDGLLFSISEINKIPTIKVDGIKKIDTVTLTDIIKHKMNPC